MWTATKLKTAASVEPVSVAEAKSHMRIESTYTAEDVYIGTLITVARDHIETLTGRKFISQTWNAYYDKWPDDRDYLHLPFAPVSSVTSVVYTDSANVAHTWSTDYYDTDLNTEPCRIVLGYSDDWPTDTLAMRNPIRVEFIAGYGSAGTACPPSLLQAIKFLVADMYESREQLIIGRNVYATKAVDNLTAPFRLWRFC
jgi:uncharacterized phiE125 gp8 family phage protein